MRAILALAGKDMRLLLRDKAGAIFTFGTPVLFALFFGTVFGGGGDDARLPIAVVDQDGSDLSHEYVARLEAADELEVSELGADEAAEAVRHGDLVGYLVLPEGFGELQARLVGGQATTLQLGVDPARQAEAGLLEGVLTSHFFDLLVDVIMDPDAIRPYIRSSLVLLRLQPDSSEHQPLTHFLGELDTFLGTMPSGDDNTGDGGPSEGSGAASAGGGGWQPLRFETASIQIDDTGPANPYQISFPQGLIWGLIGCTASFAVSMVTERTRGTLMRLRTAPIARSAVMAGKALACFGTTLGLMVGLFAIGAVFFGVRPSSLPLFALTCVVIAASFTGLMTLLGLVGRSERATSAVGWAVFMIFAMFGGGMMPLFFMPEWMQSVSDLSPIKWAILALEGTIWRGFGLAELAPALGILLGVGVVAFLLGVLVFRRGQEAN